MNAYKLTALKLGELTVDKGRLTRGTDVGKKISVPIWSTAIEGNGIKALVDTGVNSPSWAKENLSSIEDCTQGVDETMRSALDFLGWKAEEVNAVINTHLHYDHCGNNHLFPNARIYIQRREWESCLYPLTHQRELYAREWILNAVPDKSNLVLLDGEFSLADGIVILFTPGHSYGHQSVLVNTEEGIVCIAGDAANLLENAQNKILPNNLVHSPDAYKSLEDFRRKAKFIIPAHEPCMANRQSEKFPLIHG